MTNFKPFNPKDCDESLTRVVTHGGATYLIFPFINATGISPKFNSINCVIKGPAATVKDFESLSGLVEHNRTQGEWYISFNTPWLITPSESQEIKQRRSVARPKRL